MFVAMFNSSHPLFLHHDRSNTGLWETRCGERGRSDR